MCCFIREVEACVMLGNCNSVIVLIFLLFFYSCQTLDSLFEMDPRLDGKDVYTNPIYTTDWPDPTIWEGDNRFYSYSTTSLKNIKSIIASDDMITWYSTGIIPFDSETVDILRSMGSALWAPDVVYINGVYLMYITLHNSSLGQSKIVVMESSDPCGPFYYVDTIIDSIQCEISDTIDPEVICDETTKKIYMFFGSTDGIYAVELSNDGKKLQDNISYTHIAGLKAIGRPNRDQVFEGAYLYNKDGYWYLFVSAGEYYNASYKILVGRSKDPLGPYESRDGQKMSDGHGIVVLSSDNKLIFSGPGHNGEIYRDQNGKYYMYFHSHFALWDNSKRYLMLQELLWDNEGWPYFRNTQPSRFEEVPLL